VTKSTNGENLVPALLERLRVAAWLHEHPDEIPKATRWTGAILSLSALGKFVHDSDGAPELWSPLAQIIEGFKDLERGIVAPIFNPVGDPLERDKSSQRKWHHLWAAVLLELAVEQGKNRQQAAKRIAEYVNKWAALKNQMISGDTIIYWRKKLKESSKDERVEFDRLCKSLRDDPNRESTLKRVLREGPPGLPKIRKK
jgi:hypothetical protein